MTTLVSSNFDAETLGALPSGWTAKSGTWAVQALHSVSGARAFGSTTHGDGDVVLHTGIAAIADMGVQTDNVAVNVATGASARLPFVSHVLRADAAWANGYIVVLGDGGGTSANLHIEVYKKVGGTISGVSGANGVASADIRTDSPPADGDVYHMRSQIVGSQISVYVWKNGETQPSSATYSPFADSSVTAAGYAGLYNSTLGTSTAYATADNFSVDDGTPSPVTQTAAAFTPTGATAADGFVFQRTIGGTTGAVSLPISYTGTPGGIDARLVKASDGTALSGFDWATKVASPSGGVATLTFSNVPQSGFYRVQIRDTAAPGTVTSPSTTFGVGVRIALTGQSNIETLSMYDTGTPHPMLRTYDRYRNPGNWGSPTGGAGVIALGNALATALGGTIPVALIQYAVSGAGLHQGCGLATATSGGVPRDWLTTTAVVGNPWYDFSTAMALIGPSVELLVYGQGESDAMVNTNTGTYGADLATLIGKFRTLLGAGLKVVLPLLGQTNDVQSTDASWDTVRQAQLATAAADGVGVYPVAKQDLVCQASSPDLTYANLVTWGARLAQKIAYTMGLAAYGDGPRMVSAAGLSSTLYEITLAHQGGTDITPTGANAITDIRVKDGSTVVTPTAIGRYAADKIRFTLASAPAGAVTVQSSYGRIAAAQSGIVHDNTPLALPLRASAPITASAAGAPAQTDPTPPVVTDPGFTRSKVRTIKVKAAPLTFEGGPFWNLSDPKHPMGSIDKDATIDITFDWTEVLADITDTIDHIQFDIDGLTSLGAFFTAGFATIFVTAATGQPRITCRITTKSVPARIEDRTVFLKIEAE